MIMRYRVLLAAPLLLIGALFLAQVGLAFPPRGGASSGPGGGSLVALLATMPSDSWQQLNANSGNGQPYPLLTSFGFTMCNYDGLPPASCGGSGSGDYWTSDAAVAQSANGAGGANPLSSAVLFGFSAPAIRPTDGMVCGIGMGGHDAAVNSEIVCFDTQAAVTALLAAGGYGHTPTGVWTMPVKPSRLINGSNAQPAWNTQPAGAPAWATTNIDGIQMPPSCHRYWSNQWLGGNKWTQGGQYACSSLNGLFNTNDQGIGIFDSGTNIFTYPLKGVSGTFAQTTANQAATLDVYDSLSGNDCLWVPHDQVLQKWCNPTSAGTSLQTVVNANGQLAGAFSTQPYNSGAIIPDPVNGGSAYAYFEHTVDPGGSCANFFTGLDSIRHPPGSAIWANPTTTGCFILWTDIYGASPKPWMAQYQSIIPSALEGRSGTCWHAGQAKPILYKGGKTIYQVNTAFGLSNLYDPTTGISTWTVSTMNTGAGGSSPSGGPSLTNSAVGGNCMVLTGLNAEIVFVTDGSNNIDIWLHKDSVGCPGTTQIGGIIFPNTTCALTDGLGVTYQFCDFNAGCPTLGTFLFRNNGTFAPNVSKVQLDTAGGTFPTGRLFRLSTGCFAIPAEPSIWFMDQFPQAINPTSAPLANYMHNTTKGTSGLGFGLLQSGSVGDHYTFDTLQAGISIYATASRLGPNNNNSVITFASGSIAGCAQDEGNAILPVDTGGGPVDNITFTGPGIIGHEHDLDSAGYRCINYGTGTNLTIIGLTITDCDFGLQDSVVPNGTTTLTNVLFDGSGGHSNNNSSATHNVYLNNFLADSTGKVTVSGGGSYCTNGNDGGGPGFEFKTRFVAGTFVNWTAAEPSQIGSSGCQESAAIDISCGGNYVLGGAGAGQGVVLEVNHIFGNGNEIVRYGRDQRASTGGVNCATDTITASATGGVITVTAFSGHWNLGVVNEFAYINNNFSSPLGFFDGTTISGSGGVGQYGFSVTTFGSQSMKVGVQHGWSDAECQAAVSANCTLLIQNCWLINDSGNAGSTKVNLSVVTIDSSVPANVVTVKNCKLVGNGSGAALTLGTGVIDGGGNTTFSDRVAAGLAAYPALPAPP